MANVTLMGASYTDVPAVTLPQTGGGTVTFYENGGSVDVESLSVTQNGTYTAPTGKAYSPVVVNVSGGAVSADRKDVNFYDYDGSIVASYTTAEFANLDALPSNPSHTGLTAQGWNMPSNWTLTDAKTYVATNKKADWGQMYTTASGKTEIDVEFTDVNRLSPNMSLAVNGTVSIDWGDGSSATTVTGTSLTTRKNTGTHTYPAVGRYTIKITATTGSWGFYGTSKYFLLYKNDTANNNRVYSNCVQAIRIGAGCTSIGNYALYYCTSLSSITIPISVTSIGNNAFQYCYSLACVTIPYGVTGINSEAFRYCYSLTTITIPNSITSIGNNAFYDCYSLASVTIPSGVTSINTYAFYDCYSLTNATIPSSVTSIGTYAFANCRSLTNATIPSGVTSIGDSAFYGCYSLTNATIPSGVTSIGTYAFYGCYLLSNVTIPSGVTSIGNNAFGSCYVLTNVTIPNTITSISTNVFNGCQRLTSVTIPSSVTSIASSAFASCYSLASITIPSGVTDIATKAFQNCYGLGSLHFKGSTPPSVAASDAFSNLPTDCKIYVPTGKLSAYTSASNYPSSSTYTYIEE